MHLNKTVSIVLLGIVLMLFVSGCTQQQTTTKTQDESQKTPHGETAKEVHATIRAISGEDTLVDTEVLVEKGSNALDAMKKATDIGVQKFDFGVMVDSIAGVKADSKHYWGLYVNGEYAVKGIDQYVLEEDTLIEWKLEEISDFALK